jgi:HEAT repeat protein
LTNRKGSDGPSPASTLALYAHHRNPELRKQALAGLAALPVVVSPAAVPVVSLLIAALSDPSAEVRSVAAGALGARHEKSAEPALIQLLLRKDPAAPPALGQIGGPDTARALAEMIGNVPDGMILQTLGELLRRPDFGPEPVRVQVVKTVGKMPGSQTLDILGDYVTDTAKDKLRPSRVEAQKIIEQRTAK